MGHKEVRRRVNQNEGIIEDPYGNLLSYKQPTKYNLWKKLERRYLSTKLLLEADSPTLDILLLVMYKFSSG